MQSLDPAMVSNGALATRPYSDARNRQSNVALCATNTRPTSWAARSPAISSKLGASRTIALLIPVSSVMYGGMGRAGFTSE